MKSAAHTQSQRFTVEGDPSNVFALAEQQGWKITRPTLWQRVIRVCVAFNVAVASAVGVWVTAQHLTHTAWSAALLVVVLVPGWTAAAWRGWR